MWRSHHPWREHHGPKDDYKDGITDVCLRCMHRTNLYLTEDQERRLDARARARRISRSAYVRQIIDRALQEPEPVAQEVQGRLAALADSYEEIVGGLFDDDPDLRIER